MNSGTTIVMKNLGSPKSVDFDIDILSTSSGDHNESEFLARYPRIYRSSASALEQQLRMDDITAASNRSSFAGGKRSQIAADVPGSFVGHPERKRVCIDGVDEQLCVKMEQVSGEELNHRISNKQKTILNGRIHLEQDGEEEEQDVADSGSSPSGSEGGGTTNEDPDSQQRVENELINMQQKYTELIKNGLIHPFLLQHHQQHRVASQFPPLHTPQHQSLPFRPPPPHPPPAAALSQQRQQQQKEKPHDVGTVLDELKTELVSSIEKTFESAAKKLQEAAKNNSIKNNGTVDVDAYSSIFGPNFLNSEHQAAASVPNFARLFSNPLVSPSNRVPMSGQQQAFQQHEQVKNKSAGAKHLIPPPHPNPFPTDWPLRNLGFPPPVALNNLNQLYAHNFYRSLSSHHHHQQQSPSGRGHQHGGGGGGGTGGGQQHVPLNCSFLPEPEQTEALSLVAPKKKRTKVTDTRLSPRAVKALLQDTIDRRRSPPFTAPTPLPVSGPAATEPCSLGTPTSDQAAAVSSLLSGTNRKTLNYSPPTMVPQMNSHLYAATEKYGGRMLESPPATVSVGRGSPPGLGAVDITTPTTSAARTGSAGGASIHSDFVDNYDEFDTSQYEGFKTNTLSPMHLRKAKLMFYYARYPNSTLLKAYFPDVNFNKNNTAQLVKWFSNFREFFYIQMEKYARQAVVENDDIDSLTVTRDSELFRVLNLHYNRNNQLEVPDEFLTLSEKTLKEFYKSVSKGKDQESTWKKQIYKIIQRMDMEVPDFFKNSTWMEQLAD